MVGSIVQGFFGGNSPWVYEVIYVNRSKLLVSSKGIATSAEMAEVAYQVDYYIHVDSKEAALDLITHLPFNGQVIDTREVADYAGPAIEQAINQVVQVTKLENINEHINELREGVKSHLTDFLKTYGIMLNDLKILILPKDDRMRELISLQALGLTPIEFRPLLSGFENGGKGSRFRTQRRGRPALPDRRTAARRVLSSRRGNRIEQITAMADFDFDDLDALERIAVNLFYGWGYNSYRLENQLRADDLTVRAKVGWLLGQARAEVETAESAYRRLHLPPPTRQKPRPDANAVAGAQTLERLSQAIGALEGQIRAQPVPETDRMTQRYRQEAPTLQRLLECDMGLVGRAELLRQMLDKHDGDWMVDNADTILGGVKAIEASVRSRQAALLV